MGFFTSCRLGPNHCIPQVEVPENWASQEVTDEIIGVPACWWRQFNDPFVNKYIEKLQDDNLDIRIAAERINEAVYMRGVTASDMYPKIDGYAASVDAKPGTAGLTGISALSPLQIKQKTTITQFDATWEIDIFGRVRSGIESADAYIGVQTEIRNGVILSAISEFTRNYLQVRGYQRSIQLLNDQIASLTEQVSQVKSRFTTGVDAELDFQAIDEQLQNLNTRLPTLIGEYHAGIFRLSVLVGENPAFLMEELQTVEPVPEIPYTIPTTLPSEVLRRRPDIRQAERNVAQQTAEVGVAIAGLFPHVDILASDGYDRIKVLDLLLKGNVWSFTAEALTPIFRGGERVYNVREHESMRRESFLNYQNTVLLAFEETENALTNYYNDKAIEVDLTKVYELQKKIYGHNLNQYKAGIINKQVLLTAERALSSSEDNYTSARVNTGIALINLYKALGG